MKTKMISRKLSDLIDCVFAVAQQTVPGMIEADKETRELYKTLTKEILFSRLKSERRYALHTLKSFRSLSRRILHARNIPSSLNGRRLRKILKGVN